jgi:lambda family phage minor tail protein L
MKSLSSALILEKNRIATENPWLITLDVTWPDTTHSYFVRNTDNIEFQGRTYVAFPFEISTTDEQGKGNLPTVTLKISNVTRALTTFFESTGGAVGATVLIRVINAALLSENYADLELTYEVIAATIDAQWITATLGATNPLRYKFPRYRYLSLHCNWQFKGVECAFTGEGATCNRTLDACIVYGNQGRFGGFPGIDGGIRIA